jgi:hypothetical protein
MDTQEHDPMQAEHRWYEQARRRWTKHNEMPLPDVEHVLGTYAPLVLEQRRQLYSRLVVLMQYVGRTGVEHQTVICDQTWEQSVEFEQLVPALTGAYHQAVRLAQDARVVQAVSLHVGATEGTTQWGPGGGEA